MSDYLSLLVSQSPRMLIVVGLVVCAVLAVRFKPRLGQRASGFAAAGLVLMAVADLLSIASVLLVQAVARAGMGYTFFSGIALLTMLVGAIGLGLVIAAVFVRRPGQEIHP